jgi:hypothetical protein
VDRERFVREMWQAWSGGDFDTVSTGLTPDAQWRAVEDGPWNCQDRAQIINVMRENRAERRAPSGSIEEITDLGERTLVGFRPDTPPDPDGWPLDDGIRYMVLSFRDDLVSEMKGCASRQIALDYAAT